MDFIEVTLDPSLDGQPLTLEFHGASGGEAEFAVQAWSLMDPGDGSRSRLASALVGTPEIQEEAKSQGHLLYVLPAINTAEYNRLGLAIIRIDANERSDPDGAYTIVLHP